jgi:hypothetical protein
MYEADGDRSILIAPVNWHPNVDEDSDELYFRLLSAAIALGWMRPSFG